MGTRGVRYVSTFTEFPDGVWGVRVYEELSGRLAGVFAGTRPFVERVARDAETGLLALEQADEVLDLGSGTFLQAGHYGLARIGPERKPSGVYRKRNGQGF